LSDNIQIIFLYFRFWGGGIREIIIFTEKWRGLLEIREHS